ncbi:MAG: VOC family protein [Anaerolineae bacterium]|nr:VOC family protein [Anaerolineae bacterium]
MDKNQVVAGTPAAAIHPATHMGPVTLAVSDLARSVDFYTRVLGMTTLEQVASRATVGAGHTPLLHLQEIPGAQPQPQYSTGLYHVAILVPTRADLGRVILSLARYQYPIGGFGDHYVSEAMYLDDPDGNGLEIYRDRPRDSWRWQGSKVVMGTDPVDVDAVIASVEDPDAPFTGMPEGTTIGHMHLRVGDIPQARAFYAGVLGFDVVADMASALFVSAGGYHHHIGMNIWHSRRAPQPPADSVGLRQFTILVADEAARDQVATRLDAAGVAFTRADSALLFDDPWGNAVRLVPERSA